MLARYTRPQMAEIWSEENRFAAWLRVEQAVAAASARRGIIPQDAADAIARAAPPDPARVRALDPALRHDVLAFLTAGGGKLGEAERRAHSRTHLHDNGETCLF